jgi:two-component system sensor histidine kinase QseC
MSAPRSWWRNLLGSLRARLLLASLIGFIALLLGAGWFVVQRARTLLIEQFHASLTSDLRAMGAHLWLDASGAVYVDWNETYLPEYAAPSGSMAFQLWLEDGTKVQRSPLLEQGRGDLPRWGGALTAPGIGDWWLPDGRHAIAATALLVPRASFDPATTQHDPAILTREVELAVARDATALDAALADLETTVRWVALLAPALAALLLALGLSRGLRPLSRLAQRAAEIDRPDARLRFPTERLPSELLPIAQRLNELLARIEAVFQRERRFTSDAAHELRTPIAELRTLSEVALRFGDDPEHARRALDQAHSIARRMGDMVATLLSLARKDLMSADVLRETVPIVAAVEAAWAAHAPKAESRALAVRVTAPPEFSADTDPSLLNAILSNLFANACEYTAPGGRIQIQVEARPDGFAVRVANTVQDLDAGDLPQLFEPFWRKQGARNDREHFGLGLALARNLAELIGMRLDASLPNPREIAFELRPRG